MTWPTYGSFLVFAVVLVLVLVPGPDFAVITKNTLAGGRRRGSWSAAGVASSNAAQGAAERAAGAGAEPRGAVAAVSAGGGRGPDPGPAGAGLRKGKTKIKFCT